MVVEQLDEYVAANTGKYFVAATIGLVVGFARKKNRSYDYRSLPKRVTVNAAYAIWGTILYDFAQYAEYLYPGDDYPYFFAYPSEGPLYDDPAVAAGFMTGLTAATRLSRAAHDPVNKYAADSLDDFSIDEKKKR